MSENKPNPDFEFRLNMDRDFGEPGKSYVLTGLGEHLSGHIEIPSSHDGLPVGLVQLYQGLFDGNVRPNIRTIYVPAGIALHVDGSLFPSLEAIDVDDMDVRRSHYYSQDGVLYYGNKQGGLRGVLLYPPNRPGEEFELSAHTYLSKKAFYGAKNLRRIRLPDDLHMIPDGCFAHCENLESIDIPASVGEIGNSAFQGCSSLRSVTFHSEESYLDLTTVGECAFADCVSLKSIKIPPAKMAPSSIVRGCASLERIEGRFGGFVAIDGALFATDFFGHPIHFIFYPPMRKAPEDAYVLPEGTERIHRGAFLGVKTLREVKIPRSIKTIEEDAFVSSSIRTLEYPGTEEEWNAVKKDPIPSEITLRFKP